MGNQRYYSTHYESDNFSKNDEKQVLFPGKCRMWGANQSWKGDSKKFQRSMGLCSMFDLEDQLP